jgi:predicted amidohydrolase
MRIATIQHDTVWEDPAANFADLAPRVEAAAGAGARLVVLTEMFSTGFSMATERTAEPADGPSATFLHEQAERHGVWIAGSYPEAREDDDPRPANCLVLVGPDGTAYRYDKIHPFTYSGEHEHYRAGGRHVTVDVEGVRVTLFVCYDLRFADEFWATGAGTDVFLVPANWPSPRRAHWSALLRARAIENLCYVVGSNRVGTDGNGLDYTGDSAVIDPTGEVLAAGAGRPTTLLAEVDPAVVAATRERFRFLQDRRDPGAVAGG